jgi:hypothetical protein
VRIGQVRISGFRCLAAVKVDFDDLTALVGAGGAGKSTVLRALDWFFHGGDLEERDRHRGAEDTEPAAKVVVAVTFKGLGEADREALGMYVQGAESTLTRSWTEADGEKLSGNALVLPQFMPVREITGARPFRDAYVELYEKLGEELSLPKPARGADDIKADMEVWEREHPDGCELMDADARHLRGFAGTAALQRRFDYVFVSASASAAEALSDDRRKGTLARLLSVLEELDEASLERIEKLQTDAQEEIEKIVGQARGSELLSISAGLTDRVSGYFPGAAIKLQDEISPPRKPDISVRARVSDRGGHPVDPDLQGHGLQRALVIALLHELAEREARGDADAAAAPRTLMLAVEEPELYQHPLQARALAASLEQLAGRAGRREIQIAYSTHSPYFSRPALFADLRLCRRLADGSTSCVAADPSSIAAAIDEVGYGKDATQNVERALADSLREAIFARAVLLCEGDTDAAVFEGVAGTQGGLDREGVAVAPCGTKANVVIAIAVLRQLEIPFVALFDGDAAKQDAKQAKRNRQILELCKAEAADWPDREVRQRCANFAENLEADLEELWPTFGEACSRIGAELSVDPHKNPRVYRQAATEAGEPPDFVLDVLDAVRTFA